jgi:hypothetical protein
LGIRDFTDLAVTVNYVVDIVHTVGLVRRLAPKSGSAPTRVWEATGSRRPGSGRRVGSSRSTGARLGRARSPRGVNGGSRPTQSLCVRHGETATRATGPSGPRSDPSHGAPAACPTHVANTPIGRTRLCGGRWGVHATGGATPPRSDRSCGLTRLRRRCPMRPVAGVTSERSVGREGSRVAVERGRGILLKRLRQRRPPRYSLRGGRRASRYRPVSGRHRLLLGRHSLLGGCPCSVPGAHTQRVPGVTSSGQPGAPWAISIPGRPGRRRPPPATRAHRPSSTEAAGRALRPGRRSAAP